MFFKNMSCPFLLILNATTTLALKVYKNVPNENPGAQSGLHFLKTNQNIVISGSVSFCVRFRFQELSWSTRLWEIKKPNTKITNAFMWLSPNYPTTFFFFGQSASGETLNQVLKDPGKNTFILWFLNTWHQMCFSFDKSLSFIRLVKVGQIIFIISFCA